MSSSSLHPGNPNKLLNDIKGVLSQGFKTLCCKLDNASASNNDYEIFMACDTVTGDPVIVSYAFDNTGVLTITYTTINGTPFIGTVEKCPSIDYELTNFQWFCHNTIGQISRTDLYIDGVFNSYIWQDITGNIITPPVVGDYFVGLCNTQTLNQLTCNDVINNTPGSLTQSYSSTTRIIADDTNVFRTAYCNTTSELIKGCYIDTANPGFTFDGYYLILKDSLGNILNTLVYDNTITQITTGIPTSCTALTNVDIDIIPIDCYLSYDISGTPSLLRGAYLQNIYSNSTGSIISSILLDQDGKTPLNIVGAFNPHPVNCPTLKCYSDQGNPPFMGYEITVLGSAPAAVGNPPFTDMVYLFHPSGTMINSEILGNPLPWVLSNTCIIGDLSGLELYQNLSNGLQTCSFVASEITISYNPPITVSTPITVSLTGSILGSATFEVFPNNQETRKFSQGVITGANISGATSNDVTIEFQLN